LSHPHTTAPAHAGTQADTRGHAHTRTDQSSARYTTWPITDQHGKSQGRQQRYLVSKTVSIGTPSPQRRRGKTQPAERPHPEHTCKQPQARTHSAFVRAHAERTGGASCFTPEVVVRRDPAGDAMVVVCGVCGGEEGCRLSAADHRSDHAHRVIPERATSWGPSAQSGLPAPVLLPARQAVCCWPPLAGSLTSDQQQTERPARPHLERPPPVRRIALYPLSRTLTFALAGGVQTALLSSEGQGDGPRQKCAQISGGDREAQETAPKSRCVSPRMRRKSTFTTRWCRMHRRGSVRKR
jgi:hypothetical protein